MLLRLAYRLKPNILDVYIFKEILQPFFTWLFFWTTLFMSIVIKDVLGDLVGKGIELHRIAGYLYYLLAEKITQTIPIACLLSGILAAGRLSGDSEVTAMRASGISFPRIYAVFLFFGFLSMLFMGFMNLYYGPLAARERQAFQQWLQSYHSLTLVRPGSFLGSGDMDAAASDSWDIYAEGRDGSQLQDVQIRSWNSRVLPGGKTEFVTVQNIRIPIGFGVLTRIIHAEKGRIVKRVEEGEEVPIIHLEQGYMLETDKNLSTFTVTDFSEGQMNFVLPGPKKGLGKLNVQPEEYTFPELFKFLEGLEKGEHTISQEALQDGSATISEAALGEGTFRIPSPAEIETTLLQLRLWIGQNQPRVGQPGGPTKEELNAKMQYMLQLQILQEKAEKKFNEFRYEIHSRIATPLACMLFFFVSFPLGLVVKRSGKGMSFSLALFVLLLYYILLSVGTTQALSGKMLPWQGAYLPVFGVGMLGIYIMASRTEGFTPLSFLSTPFRWIYTRTLKKYVDPVLARIPLERFRDFFWNLADRIRNRGGPGHS